MSITISIVSDAWYPQINGVVRTIETLTAELEKLGHRVSITEPTGFSSIPCPSYPEIRLAWCRPSAIARRIGTVRPDAIHIATEGPLGLAARRYCVRHAIPFTTSLHTRFPEYVHARWKIPLSIGYAYLKRFHAPAATVMISTQTLQNELAERGFHNLRRWSRGVDTELFRPRSKDVLDANRPVSLYVGRVAVEKNIEDFLRLDLPGTKVVVGDGPALGNLRARYPRVRFVGVKTGEDLATYYAAADVFVFPSRTDTFGLVMLEALASGVPVAAYPVPGPLDVIGSSGVGVLSHDLLRAAREALTIDPRACRAYAERFSWRRSAEQFLGNITVVR
jgi:glycosyltransferase involved in cell wall biosynthesis